MSTSLFGALVTWQGVDSNGFNGLQRANQDFLKAVVRYSFFNELHFFLDPAQLEVFRQDWGNYLKQFGSGKAIKILPVFELPSCFEQYQYSVFHCGDPYISSLAKLREHHAPNIFPITGRAHTLSDDPDLSRIRDLLCAPIKPCDTILCSSKAQQKVMERLLSSASASLNNAIGVAVPYRGQVSMLRLGIETQPIAGTEQIIGPLTAPMKKEVRKNLGINDAGPMIICLGRLSPAGKMDLQPLLLVLNDLLEEHRVDGLQLVIAGAGDAGSEYVQQLLSMAYDLNLENHIRFELSITEERKQWLLAAADIFVSLADNVQESFGLAPVEAMGYEVPVVLSDWNGYRELVQDGVSGYLVPTRSGQVDHLSRSISLLNKHHANFIQAQSTAFDGAELAKVLERLLNDESLRQTLGSAGRARAERLFSWPALIGQYHELVESLSQEIARFRHRPGRAVGMSCQRVFGHYPTYEMAGGLLLKTSDRGLRVLLYAEKTSAYKELYYLQSRALTENILTAALKGATVEEIIHGTTDKACVLFVIARLMKFQLLEVTDARSTQSHSAYLSIHRRILNDSNTVALDYPEQRRSEMIKPLVNLFLEQLKTQHTMGDELLRSLGHLTISWMDSRLLQAIGWFAEERGVTNYGEALSALTKAGGLDYLMQSYPLWARNNRISFFKYLKIINQILRRVNNDLQDINSLFFTEDNPAKALTGVLVLLNGEDEHPVYKLQFDNGECLVYKTRDVACEKAVAGVENSLFSQVNHWLDGFARLGVYKVLPKTDADQRTYGYSEFIVAEQPEDIQAYYRNLGVLSGFCLMTGLSDINQRNVLVNGSVPYVVDSEMLLHAPILERLEGELTQPESAFARGIDNSAFNRTGLRYIWENFQIYKSRLCAYKLDSGSIVPEEPEQVVLATNHLHDIGGQSILEPTSPGILGRYAGDFVEGFERFFRILVQNNKEWKALLNNLSGIEVRYSPTLDSKSTRRLLRDIFTEVPLQQVSPEAVERYFSRMATRIARGGEILQRWTDPAWQEPVSELADSFSGSWLRLEQALFVYRGGERELYSRSYAGVKQPVCPTEYFKGNCYLDKTVELADRLASETSQLEAFLVAYKSMFNDWFNACVPSATLVPELKSGPELKPQ